MLEGRLLAAVAGLLAASCASLQRPPPEPVPAGFLQEGQASYYGGPASSVRAGMQQREFDPGMLNASHRTLPLGSCIVVTNLTNGREARVHITDRGAFSAGVIIDLSYAAARRLQILDARNGVARVRLTPCS